VGDGASAPDRIISLPSGGGAIRGLGETFSPDLQTGTGNLTIPIEVPAGRNGLQPRLDLVYSTGHGNGPLGLGWKLAIPGVARKTSSGVPTYRDADTFVLSGAEDLVPVEQLADGSTSYRPRTEGFFARIVRHGRDGGGPGEQQQPQDYWEVTGKDGLVSLYGTPRPDDAAPTWRDPAATADPADPRRIFAWALTQTRDRLGNVVVYEYDTDEGRSGGHRWRRPQLRRIRYADYTATNSSVRFLASILLEYEPRPDPFSTYTAGFEVRTSRRCRSLQTGVHPGADQPVRRYEFGYEQDDHNGVSMLTSVAVVGFDDDGAERRDLPAVRLGYGRLDPTRRRFQPVTGADPPGVALSSGDHELVDVTGDGLPDVLHLNGVARYWRNLGGGVFDLPRSMPETPAGLSLSDPGVQLLDAQGDGRADLTVTTPGIAGFFPLRFGPSWGRLSRYRAVPSTGLTGPAVQLVDLTGDGVTDAVLAGPRLECLFNDPDTGWSGPRPARFTEDPAVGPPPVVAPGDPRVRWADMSGDGLRDLVLVHQGMVEYWPNLGHGRLGARLRMDAGPRLPPDHDPRRLLLGDLDGDGLADLAYVAGGRVTVWFNRGGDAWSPPVTVPGVPEDAWDVRLADLLGTGTSGILFSRDARGTGTGRAAMYFLDLSGGVHPRLLNEIDNQLGAVTRISYSSSTAFAAADAARRATRWRTPLPIPVPVVTRVETIDEISGGKLTTAYRYRHGYWDGREREFRGFGCVEQTDTETFDAYHGHGLHGGKPFAPVDRVSFSPPTLTRTWFHLGPVETDTEDVWDELDLTTEFWTGDPPLLDHAEGVRAFLRGLEDGAGGSARAVRRDALRALRGRILRSEQYALDGSVRQDRPYTVTEHAYALREEPALATPGGRRVFLAVESAQRITEWERGDDPLTRFSFIDDHDAFGQPRRRTEVAMPRRSARRRPVAAAIVGTVDPDPVSVLATHTRTAYAAAPPGVALHDRVAQERSYELAAPPTVVESNADDLRAVLADQARTAREVAATFAALHPAEVRLIGHTVHHYDGPAYVGLPPGELGAHGLLTRSERLVFTEALLADAYRDRRPQALGGADPPPGGAPPEALAALGYRREPPGALYEEGWYADIAVRAFDVQRPGGAAAPDRGFVVGVRDPLGHETTVTPDAYRLYPVRVRNAAGLETVASYNYRAGRPRRVVDPNGTITNISYQATGLVAAVVVVDRQGQGGTPQRPDISYSYDLTAFARRREPISVHTRRRIWHASAAVSDEVIESCEYSDGFGRLVQSRAQADDLAFGPGGDDSGLGGPGMAGPAVGVRRPDRVVVSGWQVHDNKGRVIETYEPFFDTGWSYQPEADARRGRRVIRSYDARARPERVLNPDGSMQRTVFGAPASLQDPGRFVPTPWVTTAYDENDLAALSAGPDGTSLAGAAPAEHHFTPTTTVVDALTRPVCVLSRGGPASGAHHLTRTTHDVRGNVLTLVDELGRTAFRHVYDLTDRLLRVESIDTGWQCAVPDAVGNPALSHDARGAATVRTYDALNRPTRVLAREVVAAPVTLRERITYGDALPAGPAREAAAAAQAMGRVWVHDDEAVRLAIESYDQAGRILGQARTVVSDDALAAGWEPDWEATDADDALEPTSLVTRTRYDALGRAVEIRTPDGQIVAATYARSGGFRSVAVDGASFVDLVTHNARGQRVLIAYGNGMMTRYAYDRETFRLRRMRSEPASAAGDTWAGTGAPLQDLTYGYDLVGNLTGIEERTPACGVAGTLAGRHALPRVFAYDAFYRLVSATGRACADLATARPLDDASRCGAVGAPYAQAPAVPSQANAPDVTTTYVESYGYDEAGNLLDLFYRPTSGPVTTGWHRLFGISGRDPGDSAGAPDNRLTSVRNPGASVLDLGYDAGGNLLTQGGNRTYRWDHAGRLTGFTVQAGVGVSRQVRYLYDAAGARVKKWVRSGGGAANDESTVYLGPLAERHRWAAGGGGESRLLHVLDGASRIALVRSGDRHPDDLGPPVRYELADHLGSGSVTVDDSGVWVTREEYFPYGETSFGGFARKRYRFTGLERDEESGLSYHVARYYAPGLARWVSPDPAGAREGPNAYRYAGSRPTVLVDPGGEAPARPSTDGTDPPAATPTARPPPSADNLQPAGPVLRAATPAFDTSEPVDLDKIMEWVKAEDTPPSWAFWTVDRDDERHRYQVLRVVQFFMEQANDKQMRRPAEERKSRFQVLFDAKEGLTRLRQDTSLPRASESLILRDAQRYLWGRVGIEQHVREKNAPRIFTETVGPEVVYDYYEVTKTLVRPINALGKALGFDWDLMQSTRSPLAAKGGSDWFGLGLEHYWLLDRSQINLKSFPSAPRYFANEPLEDW
jgi:RHS repeat-associated protein